MIDMTAPETTDVALVMLITSNPKHWISTSTGQRCDYFPVSNANEAVSALQNVRYDLILLDDATFNREATRLISEIKRRTPTIPLIVLTETQDDERQRVLFQVGADDFIIRSMSADEINRHIRLMLRQQRQNRMLAYRTQNLHAMASLSRLLFNAQDQQTLMVEAIQLLCNTYRLYGVTLALRTGDVLRIYAGAEQSISRGKLYESIIRFDRNDPFSWTIDNGITQIYRNINEHPSYTSLPVLPAAESVIILPLTFQDQVFGSIGIYAQPGLVWSHQDLIVFEPFAAQFVVALQKVAQYQAQYVNVQSSQHLIRAWQRFSNLNTPHDVARALRELVEEVPHAGQGLVFLFDPLDGRPTSALIDSANDDARAAFRRLASGGVIDMLINSIEASGRPRVFDGRDLETGPYLPIFHTFMAMQVLFMPIVDSTRLVGGLLIGSRQGQNFTQEGIDLIENLVRTSGQMFERITLTSAIWEKSARLEAVLRTVSEGVFFIDENDNVAFANPQFGELTGIAPPEVINQSADDLLRLLANRSDDPQRIAAQLRLAQESVSRPNVMNDDYPIIEVSLPGIRRTIHIEFVKIEGLDSGTLNWAGLLRDQEIKEENETVKLLLQEVATDHLRMPYVRLRSQISTLMEEQGSLSARERDRLIKDLESSFDRFGQIWLNFVDLYNVEASGALPNREPVDVPALLHRMLGSRVFLPYARTIQLEKWAQVPQIRADELRLERALTNVLLIALGYTENSGPLLLHVDRRDPDVVVIIGGLNEQAAGELQRLMTAPRSASGDLDPQAFALYVSRALIARQGGHLYLDQDRKMGWSLVMTLPTSGATGILVPPPAHVVSTDPAREVVPQSQPVESGSHSGAPTRTMSTIMIVEGRSTLVGELHKKLKEQGYSLLPCRTGEEAIRDVNATKLDLIVLDTALRDMNGIDACARIRSRSEVPIILVADKLSETEKIRGLNVGADDYISRPIGVEEMMAKLRAIFNRMTMKERTREPLQVGDLFIDFARREVFLGGKPIELTRIEYDLLHILVTNRDQVLTHKTLLQKVWGPEYENETQYLWVNISRLRKKLEPRSESPRYIQNQLGIGYMFGEP